MTDNKNKKLKQMSISDKYALLLGRGRLAGFIILLITYTLYITSLVQPYIPVKDIEKFWSLDTTEYLEQAGISTGWSWLTMLAYSDFTNFIGIGILSGITIVCYLHIIPAFFRKKDYIYLIITILEVIVLLFAASGIIITH